MSEYNDTLSDKSLKKPSNKHEIVEKYEKLQQEAYIKRLEAARIARVTIPDMMPLGTNMSPTKVDSPSDNAAYIRPALNKTYSGIGARCVKGWASQLFWLLFPPNAKWYQIAVSEPVFNTLLQLDGNGNMPSSDDKAKARSKIDEETEKISKSIQEQMSIDQADVVLLRALEHICVQGVVIIHVMQEGGCRIIPLKNFVVKRNQSKLIYAIIKEDIGEEEVYTYVDYETNKCWQVSEDGERKKEIKDKADQYVVACSRIHESENLSYGYASQFVGQIEFVNFVKKSIEEGAMLESLISICVDASNNATITPQQLERLLNGGIFPGEVTADGRVGGVGILTFPQKLAGMQWLGQWIFQLEEQLEKDFSLSLFKQLPNSPQRTATEIVAFSQDVERDVASNVSVLRQTLQVPFVKAYMSKMGYDRLVLKKTEDGRVVRYYNGPKETDGIKIFQIQPIGGLSVLTKQMQIQQVQSLVNDLVSKVGPQIGAMYIDYVGLAKHFSELLNLPTDLIFRPDADPAMLANIMKSQLMPQQPQINQQPQQL